MTKYNIESTLKSQKNKEPLKHQDTKELSRNKVRNLYAVILYFNNLKNSRIVVLFKDFFKAIKIQKNKHKCVVYLLTTPKLHKGLVAKALTFVYLCVFVTLWQKNSFRSGLNTHIIILSVFIFSVGFIKISAGQDTSVFFLNEKTYIKDSIDNFKGEIKYYKYRDFPKLKYSKPDIKKWIKNLNQINKPLENIKYIATASENNQLKYIRLVTDTSTFTKKFYTVLNDTVKLEVTGLIVSAPNYSLYIYKNNLLNKHILYMGCSSGQEKNFILNFCPYRKEEFEYYKGTDKIRYVTTYFINKLAESERDFKTEFNKSGKQINKIYRTK